MTDIILRSISFLYRKLDFYFYRRSIPSKVRSIREKNKIKVLFVLYELSIWKTEPLYCEMLKHPRFEPVIGTSLIAADNPSEAIRKYGLLTKYLAEKKYPYVELFYNEIKSTIKPDVIFYQQPYDDVIDANLFFRSNKNSLFCHVNYGFNLTGQEWVGLSEYLHHCWQIFYENSESMNFYESTMPAFSRNKGRITGLPLQDTLEREKTEFLNPWKSQHKKKIIWAPHHTIPEMSNELHYSTFLDVADVMLEIAKEYADEIQMAFKPHPFLKKKLYKIWGKERTDIYYQKWVQMENTQFESGEYYGLFKHSDALIHDCSSFIVEYLYMGNPVMFLCNGGSHTDTLNRFGKSAFNMHVFGKTRADIELFIQNVISGVDTSSVDRDAFIKRYLAIPDTCNASLNIINSILNG
jgi:hypothetical protein